MSGQGTNSPAPVRMKNSPPNPIDSDAGVKYRMPELIIDDLDRALQAEADEKAIGEPNLSEPLPVQSSGDNHCQYSDVARLAASDTSDTSESSESLSESDECAGSDEYDEFDANESDEEIPRTKNEILRAEIPSVPASLTLNIDTPVELVGTLYSAGDSTIVIQAMSSARYRVLTEDAVFVLGGPNQPKTLIGVLFETFGPLDRPFYVVKFAENTDLSRFAGEIKSDVYQIVSTGQYTRTEQFKNKGTDASNFNDEEVPLEEQEFSDDEQEMLAKRKTKKRKRSQKPQHLPREKRQVSAPSFPAPPLMMMPPEMMQQWYQFQQFQQNQQNQQNQTQNQQNQNGNQNGTEKLRNLPY